MEDKFAALRGNSVACSYFSGRLYVLGTSSGQCLVLTLDSNFRGSHDLHCPCAVSAITLSNDESLLGSASVDGKVVVCRTPVGGTDSIPIISFMSALPLIKSISISLDFLQSNRVAVGGAQNCGLQIIQKQSIFSKTFFSGIGIPDFGLSKLGLQSLGSWTGSTVTCVSWGIIYVAWASQDPDAVFIHDIDSDDLVATFAAPVSSRNLQVSLLWAAPDNLIIGWANQVKSIGILAAGDDFGSRIVKELWSIDLAKGMNIRGLGQRKTKDTVVLTSSPGDLTSQVVLIHANTSEWAVIADVVVPGDECKLAFVAECPDKCCEIVVVGNECMNLVKLRDSDDIVARLIEEKQWEGALSVAEDFSQAGALRFFRLTDLAEKYMRFLLSKELHFQARGIYNKYIPLLKPEEQDVADRWKSLLKISSRESRASQSFLP